MGSIHIRTPTNLGKLDKAKQRYEIETNFEILKDLLDYEPNSISYPSNSYNNETLKILQDLKYHMDLELIIKLIQALLNYQE